MYTSELIPGQLESAMHHQFEQFLELLHQRHDFEAYKQADSGV